MNNSKFLFPTINFLYVGMVLEDRLLCWLVNLIIYKYKKLDIACLLPVSSTQDSSGKLGQPFFLNCPGCVPSCVLQLQYSRAYNNMSSAILIGTLSNTKSSKPETASGMSPSEGGKVNLGSTCFQCVCFRNLSLLVWAPEIFFKTSVYSHGVLTLFYQVLKKSSIKFS